MSLKSLGVEFLDLKRNEHHIALGLSGNLQYFEDTEVTGIFEIKSGS